MVKRELCNLSSSVRFWISPPFSGAVVYKSARPTLAPEKPCRCSIEVIMRPCQGWDEGSIPFICSKDAYSNCSFQNSLDGLNTFLSREQSPVRVRLPEPISASWSPHDEARIRIGMARTLSTDSSMYLDRCNSVQSEYHRAENSILPTGAKSATCRR